MFTRLLLLTSFCLLAEPIFARQGSVTFESPIDCKFGENCDIVLFVDHDKTQKWQDYRCGNLTYDNHQGTDIRIRGIELMHRGIDVKAAASGRVALVRRGLPDISFRAIGRDVIVRRGLGNVVVLNHGNGWQTIYAHLKRTSIRVAKGQKVSTGDILGQVGMSGLSEFPHLHFAVLRLGKVIDPFFVNSSSKNCGGAHKSLWSAKAMRQMKYTNAFILNAGFSDSSVFNRTALIYGLDIKKRMHHKAPNFLFAVDFAGGAPNDEYEMRIIDPRQRTIAFSKKKITKVTNFKFDFVGRKGFGRSWEKGRYEGKFGLFRLKNGVRRKILGTTRKIEVR